MNKTLAAIAITLTLVVGASASAADWQTGKIVVHPVKVHLVNLLEGIPESKWFHGTGDIICIGGDEKHAPDCRHNTLYTPSLDGPDNEDQFWTYGVVDSEEYDEVILADGEMFRVERYSPVTIFKSLIQNWFLLDSARVNEQQMKQMEPICSQGVCKSGTPTATAATEGTFEYRLGKLKDGLQEIEIKIPDYPGPGITKTKGFFKPASSTAQLAPAAPAQVTAPVDVIAARKAFIEAINKPGPGRKGHGEIVESTMILHSPECNKQNFDLLVVNPHMQEVFKNLQIKTFIYSNDLDLTFTQQFGN